MSDSDHIIKLELGDVIKITNPKNEVLNDQTFYIDYIDLHKMYLVNLESYDRIKLNIHEDGTLGDGNVTSIEILNRADEKGYARQNGLLPGKWVNVYFGGDFPVILSGEITNLEEDMIEIRTVDDDTIYINFAYKGIPEDLPIENIEIGKKPHAQGVPKDNLAQGLAESGLEDAVLDELAQEDEEADEEDPLGRKLERKTVIEDLQEDARVIPATQLQLSVPVRMVHEKLKEFIIRADQIRFGDEELGPVVQFVDVAAKAQRYSIETQVADLLDDLLSTVPSSQRTSRVLNNIHTIIERFKQLRSDYSLFDEYGNVKGLLVNDALNKPLLKWMNSFHENLYWILPVVTNVKKMYRINNDGGLGGGEDDANYSDIVDINMNVELNELSALMRNSDSLVGENKYATQYAELARHFTPFLPVDEEAQGRVLADKMVNCNINTIIDNLGEMYSTVFRRETIARRRFVVSKYNLGDTKLLTTERAGARSIAIRVPMDPNDVLSVKSIMMLPEPIIRFSKINLPNTDILTRANLNEMFFGYWQFLKTRTPMTDIMVSDTEIPEFNETSFRSQIRNYVSDYARTNEDGNVRSKAEIYSKYINAIVPKIRTLFRVMQNYITGRVSVVDVVAFLEPFLIYTEDLTFKQYLDILEFIDTQISSHNKRLMEIATIFKVIRSLRSAPLNMLSAYSIVTTIEDKLRGDVVETGYGLKLPSQGTDHSNSEYLRRFILKDYAKLYSTALAVQNIPLMFPKDVEEIFNEDVVTLKKELKQAEEKDKCKPVVIAKMYTSEEQLKQDNGAVVLYFDRQYDKTNYGVMEDNSGYAKEVLSLNPDQLKEHIMIDQMKKNKLSEEEAEYLAETLMDGHKRVKEGHYAVLYNGYAPNIVDESSYYVRKNNNWVLTKDGVVVDDPTIICNLQEKCMNMTMSKNADNCVSMDATELGLQNDLLKSIISEFDQKYHQSKQEFEERVRGQFNYFLSIMPLVSKIETHNLMKYNNQKYKMGVALIEEDNETNVDRVVSPFSQILDLILGQSDFVKKQHDLLAFSEKFTREYVPGTSETEHWLYCIKTGVQLLPAFKRRLASAFVRSQYEYRAVMEIVKTENGQLSEDGDWWTDKYTGWPICPGDFDYEEGYEDGFKMVSRAVMEEDIGSKLVQSAAPVQIKYVTPETIMINNVTNALCVAMGINLDAQKEFIINGVLDAIKATVISEVLYDDKLRAAAANNKKLPPYKHYFYTSLLNFTFGMFLIAVQTSVPSIKTRKTHPGCVRSFTGYPFEGTGDFSSLTYLACIAFDIRDSGDPWTVLKRVNAVKIQENIRTALDQVLLALPSVTRKMAEKTEYLLSNPTVEIPADHDIAKWTDFLPPLVPFKITHLLNISDEFKRKLVHNLRGGELAQREKMLVIESKIVQFSLAIQERINKVVASHKMLLHNSANEPYLENACCVGKEDESTHEYFVNKDKSIQDYNNIVESLSNILFDIRTKTEALVFQSSVNTKNIYPPISNTFDEKTIYLAFIFYCKFKSLIPTPEDLLPACTAKPDASLILQTDTIDRIIQKLKEDGRTYTNDQFMRLIELVSRQHIIPIQMGNPVLSRVVQMTSLLETIHDEQSSDEMTEQSLRDLIFNALDTDVLTEGDKMRPEVKQLNNFLLTNIEKMTIQINDFVDGSTGKATKQAIRKFKLAMANLQKWDLDNTDRNATIKIADDKLYTITNFYRTYIKNMVDVFPTIILNKVEYSSVPIPKHYKFAPSHMRKLVTYIREYYEHLSPFYGKAGLNKILAAIQRNGKNMVKIAELTPCFSRIRAGDTYLSDAINERTSRLLYEYYFLRVMVNYIELSNDPRMIVMEKENTNEVADVYSVDYIDEFNNREDVGISMQTTIDENIIAGNQMQLRQLVKDLLISYMLTFAHEKSIVDTPYEMIQDSVFKIRETEKHGVTDRLNQMNDEAREIDTVMKITKQGLYSKGMQKGLMSYDVGFYEGEEELRNTLANAERMIRAKNKNANDDNIDMLVDDYLDNQQVADDIEREEYDMSNMDEDYYDGRDNYDMPDDARDYD